MQPLDTLVNKAIKRIMNPPDMGLDFQDIFIGAPQFPEGTELQTVKTLLGDEFYSSWMDWYTDIKMNPALVEEHSAPQLIIGYYGNKFCIMYQAHHREIDISFTRCTIEEVTAILREVLALAIIPYDTHCQPIF